MALAQSKSAAVAIHAYMDELVELLRDTIPAALEQWDADAIHDARVATRRLKAAMDLLKEVAGGDEHQRFGKVLKKLRRRLGPLRDADVMIEHLEELERQTRYARAAEWVRGRLRENRDEARKEAQKKDATGRILGRLGSWWPLRQQVKELGGQVVADLLLAAVSRQLAQFSDQADRLAGSAGVGDQTPTQDPHALRISGKLLRYTLELAPVAGIAAPKAILKDFKRLQDALGLWHDHVVLSQRSAQFAAETDLALHDLGLYGLVLDLSRKAMNQSAQQLHRFGALWSSCGQRIKGQIEAIFAMSPADVSSAPAAEQEPPAQAASPAAAVSPAGAANEADESRATEGGTP